MPLVVFLVALLFGIGHATTSSNDGQSDVNFNRAPASLVQNHVQFVILAASSTGSTWVNHVLTTHPCIVSVGEMLMRNESLQRQFHTSREGMRRVLMLAAREGRRLMRERIEKRSGGARGHTCTQTASGIKLKLYERDVTLRLDGNIDWLREELGELGWPLLLLERTNHLDTEIGVLSRTSTKQLHCRAATCDPSSLNISLRLPCAPMLHSMIDREILTWKVAVALSATRLNRLKLPFIMQKRLSSRAHAPGPLAPLLCFHRRVEYETLLDHPEVWPKMLKMLRVSPNDGCVLRQDLQKRVQQTQREVISNFGETAACLRNSRTKLDKYLRPDFRPSSGVLPIESPSLCPNATHRNSFLVPMRRPARADAQSVLSGAVASLHATH